MTKSHFCPISPLELQWGGGGSSSKGRDTYVWKTHFLTLISIGPRTKNPLWAVCYSKIWFLWNCLMYTYSIQYMIYTVPVSCNLSVCSPPSGLADDSFHLSPTVEDPLVVANIPRICTNFEIWRKKLKAFECCELRPRFWYLDSLNPQ